MGKEKPRPLREGGSYRLRDVLDEIDGDRAELLPAVFTIALGIDLLNARKQDTNFSSLSENEALGRAVFTLTMEGYKCSRSFSSNGIRYKCRQIRVRGGGARLSDLGVPGIENGRGYTSAQLCGWVSCNGTRGLPDRFDIYPSNDHDLTANATRYERTSLRLFDVGYGRSRFNLRDGRWIRDEFTRAPA